MADTQTGPRKKISLLMILPPLIFAAFAVMAYLGMQRGDTSILPSTFIGRQAPALPEETLEGFPSVADADLRSGEVTVVNFWASWCPPCRAEHPRLLELQDEGVRIVGVNFKDKAGAASGYLAEAESPFIGVPYDPQGRTAIEWGVTGPPETFIVAGDGTILHKHTGPLAGTLYTDVFLPKLHEALGR
ncbi:DsbE family thiol:disulfide interchange protein [Salipiger abyssi]|uniref:Cytochrome c biogenesis protein CcmG, thiol:disulfide interchange protein DsbE n=1 Tax=Salipiger abyssi TaxID=1250539 RepID=A0A1P8UXX7_9RHOB|nr:DsbE family thiol:disulfide interchange protein [Salipiger abyssi]APZ54243.1 cytochrome c biogenesis protein CcmG, thiol:disulfide interchange protein DsbE [Salipiger abyssi]